MRLWSAPTGLFPYSFDEVASVFWDRYPNSFAKHIVSEDVLERKITENTIVTKKLIVKHGVANTGKGLTEVLEHRFGIRNLASIPKEKMKQIREKLFKTHLVAELKCEEK
ncbi:unnamed protein product [Nippostrongylus brasiliensis]|uniref:PRELI/MSF1 domain-containing protein n=1 Tax=Nippostrongylus brasiliensis TaxID=27835 RepID=A0A0N4YW21_NIPBR|nr:unnamed protein product [Nippostrongylus brasiliensis]